MKKVLSLLLALMMVVSCMAGITFTTAAAETETKTDLYPAGAGTTNQYATGGQTSYAQKLTVPAGQVLTGVELRMSYTYGQGTNGVKFAVYQWKGDYATTVAGAPLYVEDPTTKISDNTQHCRIATIDSTLYQIEGEILWVVSRTGGNTANIGCGIATAVTDGVKSFSNGVEKYSGFWGGSGAGIAASIYTVEKPAEVVNGMDLYEGGAGSGQYRWNLDTKEIGQKFTVPAGKVLTSYTVNTLNDYKGTPNTGRFAIYQWNKSYAISVGQDPLFTYDFADQNNRGLTVEIPESAGVGGDVLVVLYWLTGAADSTGWKPNAAAALASGVSYFRAGVADNGASEALGWMSSITWADGAVNENKLTQVPLYTGAYNTGGEFTNSGMAAAGKTNQTAGQKFTLDGQILAGLSFDMLRTYDDSVSQNRGYLKVYVWDTDYATTVANAPAYTAEIVNHGNNKPASFAIPTSLGLTGTLYYEISCVEASANMNHGYVPGTGAAKAGVESFRNGAPISSVWSGDKNIGCDVWVVNQEVINYPLYTVNGGTQYTGNTNHTAVIGQTAIIPADKALTYVDFGSMRTTNYSSAVSGTFAIYSWTGSYAESTSRTPLYTLSVSYGNNAKALISVPASLGITGPIIWTLTPSANSSVSFNPDTANDQIAGTASYTNGVAKAGPWGGYIKCALGLVANGEKVSGEHETSMFTGAPTYNFGYWDTTKQFGQKLTVPAGEKLTSVSTLWLINSGNTDVYNNKFTVDFYNWDTDFATTAATAPVYSVDVVVGNNAWCTITIPDDVIITGDFMWYIKDSFGDKEKAATPSGATGYVDGVLNLTNGLVANGGLHNGTTGWSSCNTIATKIASEDLGVIYMNSVSKDIIYSGTLTFDEMSSKIRTEFRAKANAYANGAWGAWDGTFTQVGNVYYTNHTYAENATVNGEAVALDGNNVTVEAAPVKDGAKFLYWAVNGQVATNAPIFKWYPQSATDALVAVYEGEGEAITAPIAPAVKVDRDASKLTVTVTPAHLGGFNVVEYGYYISVGTEIDVNALDGVIKDAANNATAAYQQTSYNLKPATASKTVYVVTYVTYMDGETPVTVYGEVVAAPAV